MDLAALHLHSTNFVLANSRFIHMNSFLQLQVTILLQLLLLELFRFISDDQFRNPNCKTMTFSLMKYFKILFEV